LSAKQESPKDHQWPPQMRPPGWFESTSLVRPTAIRTTGQIQSTLCRESNGRLSAGTGLPKADDNDSGQQVARIAAGRVRFHALMLGRRAARIPRNSANVTVPAGEWRRAECHVQHLSDSTHIDIPGKCPNFDSLALGFVAWGSKWWVTSASGGSRNDKNKEVSNVACRVRAYALATGSFLFCSRASPLRCSDRNTGTPARLGCRIRAAR